MTPGTILVDTAAEDAVADFLADELIDMLVVLEALAGGGDDMLRAANGRFKAVIAAMASSLGQPDETPTRKQSIATPPATIDPRWTHAAVWRHGGETLVVTLSGPQGGAHEVCLARGKA